MSLLYKHDQQDYTNPTHFAVNAKSNTKQPFFPQLADLASLVYTTAILHPENLVPPPKSFLMTPSPRHVDALYQFRVFRLLFFEPRSNEFSIFQ